MNTAVPRIFIMLRSAAAAATSDCSCDGVNEKMIVQRHPQSGHQQQH
jgi:hypothetical protein